MVNKLLCILLFCLSFTIASAQQDVLLRGKVMSGRAGVPEAFVINKVTGGETKTGSDGTFSITAKPGHVLVVYNTKIMVREFMLNADSFKNMPYVVSVNYKVSELDEVVITKYGNINSVSLGIVPANQKRYTVAERRLYTAGYGSIGLTTLINVINGRIKKLKRAYETEKQEVVVEGIKDLYDEEDIQERFKIPKERVKGFIYYAMENKEFVTVVKAKNKTYADFLLLGLSKDYMNLQEEGQ